MPAPHPGADIGLGGSAVCPGSAVPANTPLAGRIPAGQSFPIYPFWMESSPKINVWSLFASLVTVFPGLGEFSPPPNTHYREILDTLLAKAASTIFRKMEPMAKKDPRHRESAAQMPLHLFDGEGLTTPRSEIPRIEPSSPSTPSPAANNGIMAPQWLADEAHLLFYMPRVPDFAPGLFPYLPKRGSPFPSS